MYEAFKALASEKFPKSAFLVISMSEDKTIKTFALGPHSLSDGDMIGMAEIGKAALLHRMFSTNAVVDNVASHIPKEIIDPSPECAS